jgi:dipeptidyl aminopeptidase/acylaminoacyl peptidase
MSKFPPRIAPAVSGANDVVPAELCRVSQDLSRIAFWCPGAGPPGVFFGAVQNSRFNDLSSQRVASIAQRTSVADLSWSGDGQFLAFTLTSGPPPGEVRVGAVRLADGRMSVHAGMSFAFAGSGATVLIANPAASRVYLRDLRLDVEHEHTVCDLADDGDPHFPPAISASPDGRQFVVTSRRVREKTTRVDLAHHDSGRWRASHLTDIPSAWVRTLPFWSWDGKSCALYIVDLENRRTAIVAIPDRDGDGEILYNSDAIDGVVTPAAHPGGRFIAMVRTFAGENELAPRIERLALVDPVDQASAVIGEEGKRVKWLRFLDSQTLLVEAGPEVWTVKVAV